jgi:hypothetical protein
MNLADAAAVAQVVIGVAALVIARASVITANAANRRADSAMTQARDAGGVAEEYEKIRLSIDLMRAFEHDVRALANVS